MRGIGLGVLLLAASIGLAPVMAAAAGHGTDRQVPKMRAETAARAFSFGQSPDRGSPLWTRGVGGASLGPKCGAASKQPSRKAIERALDEAERLRPHSGFGMSMKKEDRTWSKQPGQPRPDEKLNLDSRHVLRAFADFESGSDLSVSVGPELILKDEHNNMSRASNNDQPDSALGLGMNFKLDF